ncbi:hypothetical protein MKW94_005360 [Papaver nudicaule]|uniref:RING-type domain-containing protein n=1 Tax=Papaver nudicaule TaxID=74823 RepID=A0AA41V5F5_PAPNU|nr:hypothetical protein [Papaver nudicaule]
MGKRRRNLKKPLICSSDIARPCSSGKNFSSEVKSANEVPHNTKPINSSTGSKSHASELAQVYQNGIGHSVFLSRPRHHSINHYPHQGFGNTAGSLSLLNKNTTPLFDEKFFCNLANRWHTQPGCRPGITDAIAKISHKSTGRIRASSSVKDATATTTTHDIVKALCGICLNLLNKKPYNNQDETEPSHELSVVAILVCGHVYHGDCLEQRTSELDKSDPSCPICFESISLPSNKDNVTVVREDN